ncbi:SET domain-containing protein [Fusarium keratoplasticum]|uniref:SET domain-containing protein n=1 Tax=Fusarium keratoplasticum TaxID=1328300 RepID=A0ACC0QSY1_9HYPO|nr:SET domain-containing protein [Fusarium keratoplasticum]KAI8663632.1 SET domain-containing protein [Fusarium keratoplasticum]KAI8664276.1 SET domain-containing protein [Fusarium keratoplasticum]
MEELLYDNPVYEIRLVPGKGYGIVAASKIPKGTRILSEAPIVRLPREAVSVDQPQATKYQLWVSIAAKLAAYPPVYKRAYLELWDSYPEESDEVGIALTNALPLGPSSSTCGVFLRASRFNHSCHPNAQETWNDSIKKLNFHACWDIEEGEEITISYLKKRACYKTRQASLQANCRFQCLCSLCSLPVTKRKLSDTRLEEIQRLKNEVTSTMAHLLNPLDNLHKVHKMLTLMINEGIRDVSIPRAYYDAFLTAISHGDQARAKVFADRALHSRRTVEGNDSAMVKKLEQLSHHPYTHQDYKQTEKWKTNIEDAPRGFPTPDFEIWLWRRDKPRELQFADLRCTPTFPCFNDLPGEHEANTEFFEATDAFNCQPKKYWALLADILHVDEGDGGDLKVTVEDKNWKKVPVLLRTSEFGDTFDRSMVKRGHTILILFPVKDESMDGLPGIVVDKLDALKVLLHSNP